MWIFVIPALGRSCWLRGVQGTGRPRCQVWEGSKGWERSNPWVGPSLPFPSLQDGSQGPGWSAAAQGGDTRGLRAQGGSTAASGRGWVGAKGAELALLGGPHQCLCQPGRAAAPLGAVSGIPGKLGWVIQARERAEREGLRGELRAGGAAPTRRGRRRLCRDFRGSLGRNQLQNFTCCSLEERPILERCGESFNFNGI